VSGVPETHGLLPRIDNVRVVRAHRDEDGGKWAAALAGGAWLAGSTLLKQDGPGWVRRATMMGREVVIKCRDVDSAWSRLKCALGRGKGDRHWWGAAMLAAKRVPTAQVLVLARARIAGRDCELLAMQWVDGPTLLRVMADVHAGVRGAPSVRAQHAIARAVGAQLAQMDLLFNRDHKPSNLVVTRAAIQAGESRSRIALIDCEGVRASAINARARMLASLVIEPTGCGVRPRRPVMMRALREWLDAATKEEMAAGWESPLTPRERRDVLGRVWRDVARMVARHGDPTPRVNPLVPPSDRSATIEVV